MNECDLFIAAMKLEDAAQRAVYLDEACASDLTLRQRIDALIAAYCQAGSFLEQSKVGAQSTMPMSPVEEPCCRIGHYKLREALGEGGMGTVFVAEQESPVRRKVALKLIKLGMDSRSVIARFEAERQALALMDHPNIARVLDAGTTDSGRPYFVMELVKGTTITEHCDTYKLETRARLELFLQVCQAVQHAHQKGIIHRDLKPSNILVAMNDATPVIKVIDFGVAKAIGPQLTDQTIYTGFNQIIGTPLYMSPEQAGQSSVDIDTRSDIYSLGVLLYEVLTGYTPFDSAALKQAGFDEMRRMIREVEPPRPSAKISTLDAKHLTTVAESRQMEPRKLSQQLRGELDWIVMKALEKDRNRRYETANSFARDVQRFLSNEAVEARPASASYRLQKLMQRNQGAFFAAGLILATLIAGIVGTTLGLVRAVKAESLAKQRLLGAEQAEADTLAAYRASTDDAIEQLIGSKEQFGPKEKAYLENTLKRWQAFATRQGTDERSQAIRADGYYNVAKLWAKLGRDDEAQTEIQTAIDIQKKLVETRPTVDEYQLGLSQSLSHFGNLLRGLKKHEDAQAAYESAIGIQKKLVAKFPDLPGYQADLASTQGNWALLLNDLGRLEESLAALQAVNEAWKRLVDRFPGEHKYLDSLNFNQGNRGMQLFHFGKYAEAKLALEFARDNQRLLVEQDPLVPEYRFHLAGFHLHSAELQQHLGNTEAALVDQRAATELHKNLVADFPTLPEYKRELVKSHQVLSQLMNRAGRKEEAEKENRAGGELAKKLVDEFPKVAEYKYLLAVCQYELSIVLQESGKDAGALKACQSAFEVQKTLVEQNPEVPDYQYAFGSFNSRLGLLYSSLGKHTEGIAALRAACDVLSTLVEHFPNEPDYYSSLANTHNNLSCVLQELGKNEEAQAEDEAALEIHKSLVERFPAVPDYQVWLGGSYCNAGIRSFDEGRAEKSLELFNQAILTLQDVYNKHSNHSTAREFLCNCFDSRADTYEYLQNFAEAANDRNRAVEFSSVEQKPRFQARRAISQLRSGMVDEALTAMAELTKEELSKAEASSAEQWYEFACFYSIASSKFAVRKQEYADLAMELLKKSLQANPMTAALVANDTDLDPLRERDDFQQWFDSPPSP